MGERILGSALGVTLEIFDSPGGYICGEETALLEALEGRRAEPRNRFPEVIEVGMRFEGVPGDREEEALIYTITDITPESVVVDGNHPLAGERLWFKATVNAVRAATQEELQHGHVHGELGVHTH